MLVRFYRNLNFLERCLKNSQISIFMKIRPVEAELFHVDEKLTDRHKEANSRIYFAKISTNQFLYDVSVEYRQQMLTYSGRKITVKDRDIRIENRNYESRPFSRSFVKM